jgi:chromosome segregation ATPase
MKSQALILTLAAGAALFSISGHAQATREKGTLEERVTALEQELEKTNATLAGLRDEAQAKAAGLDAITRYLQSQAREASAMVKTLAAAESQGFVAGINFPSRETLLSGWRAQLAALQKSVPGGEVEAAEPEPNRRR